MVLDVKNCGYILHTGISAPIISQKCTIHTWSQMGGLTRELEPATHSLKSKGQFFTTMFAMFSGYL